ncbi:MAG: acyl-CoA/acyl-ACP dehydrogenase [Deltaproteobacteria bacterium]|nr:acyl-CoA/acyl-ACP dehydrogenase [Deltaproteobacteria bacterium]
MNFDFSEDQKLLQQTARDYLAENAPLAACRAVLESDQPYSRELWQGAAELGWLGTAIPESYGGAGFGQLELAVIAEEVGRALAPIPLASSTYLATEALLLAGSDEQKQRYLPRLATGEAIGTLALTEAAGQNATEAVRASFHDGKLSGAKQPVPDGGVADFAVVAAQASAGTSLVLLDLTGDGVTRQPLDSIDPSRPVAGLRFDAAPAELLGAEGEGAALASRVLDRAAVLMAFEQLGSAARAFDITREFTLGRFAFGRPVASFQVIKHRLADLWCELELARSNSYYGAWALSNDAPELAVAACLSRISTSEAFDLATVEMIQMHGGVGYTWEYDCHLFYRRAKFDAAILGSTSHWRDQLITRIEAQAAA